MNNYSADSPRNQARHWLITILIVVTATISWVAWQRLPNIAYMTDENTATTGWAALRLGWPVWLLVGAASALLAAGIAGWAGKNARERDAQARVKRAERQAEEANDIAEDAVIDAQASLSTQMRRAERTEQQAREKIAAAQASRTAADAEAERARTRVAELECDLGRSKARLKGSLRAMQQGEAETAALRTELAILRNEVVP